MRYLLILSILFSNFALADWRDALADMTKEANRREKLLDDYYIEEAKMIKDDIESLTEMHESFAMCYAYASLRSDKTARMDASRYLAHHDAFAKAHSKIKGINFLALRVNGKPVPSLRLLFKRRIEKSIASNTVNWKLLNGICGEMKEITTEIEQEISGAK